MRTGFIAPLQCQIARATPSSAARLRALEDGLLAALLTTRGFIRGKPGLPHFNYAAQVAEKFLGYVFEVPAEVVAARDGITATATTDTDKQVD